MVASASSSSSDVSLAVQDAVTLADGGQADGLREMTLSGAGRTEKESVLAPIDELGGGELEDEAAIHLLVEIEVEGIEGLVWHREIEPA